MNAINGISGNFSFAIVLLTPNCFLIRTMVGNGRAFSLKFLTSDPVVIAANLITSCGGGNLIKLFSTTWSMPLAVFKN